MISIHLYVFFLALSFGAHLHTPLVLLSYLPHSVSVFVPEKQAFLLSWDHFSVRTELLSVKALRLTEMLVYAPNLLPRDVCFLLSPVLYVVI